MEQDGGGYPANDRVATVEGGAASAGKAGKAVQYLGIRAQNSAGQPLQSSHTNEKKTSTQANSQEYHSVHIKQNNQST
jgi:hypothetical protein